MVIDSDFDLMRRVRQGDADSFEEWLRRYRTPLVKYFCLLVRDHSLAEDPAQEAFLLVLAAGAASLILIVGLLFVVHRRNLTLQTPLTSPARRLREM